MSHMNILNISREIDRIKNNIIDVNTNVETFNSSFSNNLRDLNDIKANKTEIVASIDEIREDFKFMESKLNLIDNNVKNLMNRDLDYVNKNNKEFTTFLRNKLDFDTKKINIIIYVLECQSIHEAILLDNSDLLELGFTNDEVIRLKNKCKDEIESLIQV